MLHSCHYLIDKSCTQEMITFYVGVLRVSEGGDDKVDRYFSPFVILVC